MTLVLVSLRNKLPLEAEGVVWTGTGSPSPQKMVDRAISPSYGEWSDETFQADVARSRERLRQAAREARADYTAGRVEPFPEP